MATEEDRVSAQRPRGYWESNVVSGRRRVMAAIARRLAPLEGLLVADVGCDDTRAAVHLAARGARAFAIAGAMPVLPGPGQRNRLLVADTAQPAMVGADVLLVRELVEGLSEPGRQRFLSSLDRWKAPRLILVARGPTRWGSLQSRATGDRVPTSIDPVELLRTVHLETSYRLQSREEIRQRNYRALIAEFRHASR